MRIEPEKLIYQGLSTELRQERRTSFARMHKREVELNQLDNESG